MNSIFPKRAIPNALEALTGGLGGLQVPEPACHPHRPSNWPLDGGRLVRGAWGFERILEWPWPATFADAIRLPWGSRRHAGYVPPVMGSGLPGMGKQKGSGKGRQPKTPQRTHGMRLSEQDRACAGDRSAKKAGSTQKVGPPCRPLRSTRLCPGGGRATTATADGTRMCRAGLNGIGGEREWAAFYGSSRGADSQTKDRRCVLVYWIIVREYSAIIARFRSKPRDYRG